jgi:ribulose-5-phosphate 4-epimerase/fuculose-1-phosphate aldolase
MTSIVTQVESAEELEVPEGPSFADPLEVRAHRKRMLAGALRIFAGYGFDEGIAGHITARDPIQTDHFWVNPYGVHFSKVRVSDLLLVSRAGKVVEGTRRTNRAAFHIHEAIHRARPDIEAAAHAHTIHGRAWGCLDRPLEPIVQEACAFYEDHAIYGQYGGLVLTREESDRIAATLGQRKAVILRHHGLITVGGSVEEAAWWFIMMDRCCQIQLLAEAAGAPLVMSHSDALLARRQFGNRNLARYSFETLFDAVVADQPDLLE